MRVYLDAVTCTCGRRLVLTAGDPGGWARGVGERGLSVRIEAVALAALRSGWLYYATTSAWSCPVCVDHSDAASPVYRSAVARMVERVRRAVRP